MMTYTPRLKQIFTLENYYFRISKTKSIFQKGFLSFQKAF
eukprot:UN28223